MKTDFITKKEEDVTIDLLTNKEEGTNISVESADKKDEFGGDLLLSNI